MARLRRTYYDHDEAYRRIRARGGRGWDDLNPAAAQGSYSALQEFLASPLCPTDEGGRAVDLGCGGGESSCLVARAGFLTTGVDFSPNAIALAKENAQAEGLDVDFRVGDCLDLGALPASGFDLAVDNHTLHCLIGPDRHRFLREVRRLLRPRGILFLETMSAEGSPDFPGLGVDPIRRTDAHQTRYWTTLPELLTELARVGFSPIEVRRRPQPESPSPGDTIVIAARRD